MIDSKSFKKIEGILNNMISNILHGGTSDPDWDDLENAARCFNILQMLELKIKNEKDIREILEEQNICNHNFIKGL